MVREALIRNVGKEQHKGASRIRDFILGWQDGLVNVLGVILGVAAATNQVRVVLIAGLAATFAESISMMAVAYTSFKAEADLYKSEMAREEREVRDVPATEKKEVTSIFRHMGFSGSLLNAAVKRITSNKHRWVMMMMENELKLSPPKHSPLNIGMIVGFSAFVGSLIPLGPFIFLPVQTAVVVSLLISTVVLFFVGAYKSHTTVGSPLRGGVEMAAIGMMAALIGYAVGSVFGAVITG